MVADFIKKFCHHVSPFCLRRFASMLFTCFLFTAMVSCNANNNKTITPPKDTAGTPATATTADTTKTIVFFGNSLTAGYGLEPKYAFPQLIQHTIDSLKLEYRVVNAGVSGETSAGGNARIDWILKQRVDVFVLELGGNDGLRGIPVAETRKNLQAIIDRVKAKHPDASILLAGMQIAPNMGETYSTEFRQIYPQLAKQNNLVLIPFLLQGVGGEAKLNQVDGMHPNEEGAKIVADNVWKYLQGVLK